MFLLVPAYPGCPGQTAVKWLLLLLLLLVDLEGHLPNAGLTKCNLINICATFSMVLIDTAHRASAIAELLVYDNIKCTLTVAITTEFKMFSQ